MANFQDLFEEIESELSKGGLSLITDEVKTAVNDAVAFYEVYPFRFNQGFDGATIITAAGTEVYDLPADFLVWRRGQILYSATDLQRLELLDFDDYQAIREDSNSADGQSDFCAIYDDDLYLYPTPSNIYTVRLYYTKRLASVPLAANSDSNAWTNRARLLIKCRAKYLLALHRVQNADWASLLAQAERAELQSLQTEYGRQNAPRYLQPDRAFL
jgi:hypothetical protein